MKALVKILFQTFVNSFYKENAGLFVFVFSMFFFIVGMVDGAGLYHYHYSLVNAMLTSPVFLLVVFFTWFLYARKFTGFVAGIIANPAFQFLQIYTLLESRKRFRLFLLIELLLLLPVLLYLLFISFVAVQEKAFLQLIVIYGYVTLLTVLPATLHVKLLNSINNKKRWSVELCRDILKSHPVDFHPYCCGLFSGRKLPPGPALKFILAAFYT